MSADIKGTFLSTYLSSSSVVSSLFCIYPFCGSGKVSAYTVKCNRTRRTQLIHLKRYNATSPSTNHGPVTRDNPHRVASSSIQELFSLSHHYAFTHIRANVTAEEDTIHVYIPHSQEHKSLIHEQTHVSYCAATQCCLAKKIISSNRVMISGKQKDDAVSVFLNVPSSSGTGAKRCLVPFHLQGGEISQTQRFTSERPRWINRSAGRGTKKMNGLLDFGTSCPFKRTTFGEDQCKVSSDATVPL